MKGEGSLLLHVQWLLEIEIVTGCTFTYSYEYIPAFMALIGGDSWTIWF